MHCTASLMQRYGSNWLPSGMWQGVTKDAAGNQMVTDSVTGTVVNCAVLMKHQVIDTDQTTAAPSAPAHQPPLLPLQDFSHEQISSCKV